MDTLFGTYAIVPAERHTGFCLYSVDILDADIHLSRVLSRAKASGYGIAKGQCIQGKRITFVNEARQRFVVWEQGELVLYDCTDREAFLEQMEKETPKQKKARKESDLKRQAFRELETIYETYQSRGDWKSVGRQEWLEYRKKWEEDWLNGGREEYLERLAQRKAAERREDERKRRQALRRRMKMS